MMQLENCLVGRDCSEGKCKCWKIIQHQNCLIKTLLSLFVWKVISVIFLLEQKINTDVSVRTVVCYYLTDWSGETIQKRPLFAAENSFCLRTNCISFQVWDHSRTWDRVTMSLELAEKCACCFLGEIGREYSGSRVAKIIAKFFQQSSQIWRSLLFQPIASWNFPIFNFLFFSSHNHSDRALGCHH